MADLTGKNISATYTRLVQVSESQLYDGSGGILPIQFDSENVIISGTLTAQTYVVSESVTAVTSGSTIFGNSSDDTHQFTGSANILGNITASGNISASGTITANDFRVLGGDVLLDSTGKIKWIFNFGRQNKFRHKEAATSGGKKHG